MRTRWTVLGYVLLGGAWGILAFLSDERLLYRTLRAVGGILFLGLAAYIHLAREHPIRSRLRQ